MHTHLLCVKLLRFRTLFNGFLFVRSRSLLLFVFRCTSLLTLSCFFSRSFYFKCLASASRWFELRLKVFNFFKYCSGFWSFRFFRRTLYTKTYTRAAVGVFRTANAFHVGKKLLIVIVLTCSFVDTPHQWNS